MFLVRVRNSNIQKGKNWDYRFIYYLKTLTKIILVTLYSESDQGDITADTINRIVANFEFQSDD